MSPDPPIEREVADYIATEPRTGREGKAQRVDVPPSQRTVPPPVPASPPPEVPASPKSIQVVAQEVIASDGPAKGRPGKDEADGSRSLIKIGAIITAVGVGVVGVGGGVYIATHHTSTSSTSQGSSAAQGSATPGSSASPGVTIPSDPAQAVKEALIRSVTPTVSVHHDTRIVTAADTQTTRYVDTYSTNPQAVYSIGTLADGSAVSAVTVADGTTCSTSFGQTNVFKSQPLTQFNNYGAFGRLFAITDPKFEPDGPGPLGETTKHTYKKIIGKGPPFANQPKGRTFQVNTIEVFIDPATGMIAAVVEHAIFTDANGTVTEQTETRYDVNNKPDVNIPKCP